MTKVDQTGVLFAMSCPLVCDTVPSPPNKETRRPALRIYPHISAYQHEIHKNYHELRNLITAQVRMIAPPIYATLPATRHRLLKTPWDDKGVDEVCLPKMTFFCQRRLPNMCGCEHSQTGIAQLDNDRVPHEASCWCPNLCTPPQNIFLLGILLQKASKYMRGGSNGQAYG
ncbi:unnamed protein product [Hymenolepis diminuta]|uniref:Uncharacterized protein n=1 Tax=Hymenolepis diminuta TaxID=6216 RepID=A0A0R3ST86_HYMDI|nr:unnamed protein product [Hymenolepis diminuta]